MGTNFYVRGYRHDDGPMTHIGKRSAAGLYCWDCGVTLCKGGESQVHMGRWEDQDERWYKKCPKCGKSPLKESFETSSSGRELGFNKTQPTKKTGVQSCSSFSWCVF